MFINVGLGWILDLCPGRRALRRLGWLESGGREGGKVQDVLSPTSCGVEEPGKAALHTRLPKLALEALKEHHFPVL